MRFFAVPPVTNRGTPLHDGTTTLPEKPYETVVFGRGISRRTGCGFRELTRATA
jgi:hypothetical protein